MMQLGGLSLAGVIGTWAWAFYSVPSEASQGPVYRILYLHVPAALAAFALSLALCVISVLTLWRKDDQAKQELMRTAQAVAEVGALFTLITLASGSIWGKPTWGTWWTWDARLTTTFILGLLYLGYLLLASFLEHDEARLKACPVLGILIFADVPIIYKSVTWWRTLHQPPSLLTTSGTTMAPPIFLALMCTMIATMIWAVWLITFRLQTLRLEADVERLGR